MVLGLIYKNGGKKMIKKKFITTREIDLEKIEEEKKREQEIEEMKEAEEEEEEDND